ncbi:MFS general substrate transporter [Marasmius fiardii PR-910]|nr:MFS general substrate transporter [Marasmius fiardii PR-910]
MSTEETRPLLAREGNGGNERLQSRSSRLSPVILIAPVALASRFAVQLPQTTALYLVQQLICREYFLSTDPQKVPIDDPMPDELCSVDGVKKLYALTITILVAVGGFLSIVGYQVINYFASRYGRKPAMIGAVITALSSNVFLITSPWMGSGWLEIVWLILWQLFESLSNVLLMLFLVNLYILDTVDAESRTAALSAMNGWATLGDAVSFSVGGNITTHTHRALPVYYVAASIHALNLLYIIFLVPESFAKEKRDDLERERIEEASRRKAIVSQLPVRKRLLYRLSEYLGPLKLLKPSIDKRTGRRNWRLFICAVHVFLVMLGAGYATMAMMTLLTSIYNYKPADTGYALALFSVTASFTMAFVIPRLLRMLRPLYRRWSRREVQEAPGDTDNNNDSTDESTDRLDVHVTVGSWLLEACGFLLASHAATRFGQYASVVVIGLSAARSPVFRSLVASSVEPLKQGEALTAIEMVSSVGLFISPLLLGTILTKTILTMPTLVFWVNAALVLSASGILLLVRESDRYQRPH